MISPVNKKNIPDSNGKTKKAQGLFFNLKLLPSTKAEIIEGKKAIIPNIATGKLTNSKYN